LECEWDQPKADANRRKHGVSFKEAQSCFDDPFGKIEYDLGHSALEDRWLIIGLSVQFRLLSVIYTRRHEAIRIISARRANRAETRRYAE
jgi:uncharacterized DUF497 family protein